ncbi:hypothetical protein LCGC14_1818930 [marine sediment metagenome]|uniref:SprT-like domain-containing protein n=1 Tax=marine sediment metagenome TaxID=412755 RepID=A0A0F9GJK5_9ZZZZ
MTEFYYKEITDDEVDAPKLARAKYVLAYCQKVLSLSMIIIKWCVEIDKATYDSCGKSPFGEVVKTLKGMNVWREEFDGMTKLVSQRNVIWIRADIPVDMITETVAHECKHVSDFARYGIFNKQEEERRADNFGRKVMREIWE